MRRKDREVTDKEKIIEIIEACPYCHLALSDGKCPYIVPLNFGYAEEDGHLTLYFHGAKEGKKVDLIRKTGYAGFEMETGYALRESDTACNHTAAFQSVIGKGSISIAETPEEKIKGLRQIMRKNTKKEGWDFPKPMLEAVCVMKLEVEELTAKVHE